jgi:bifunctional non-homologous end joining protein LigD
VALKEYSRKRDFERTAEPPGRRLQRGGHRFVVQKHAARRLHYDFRLELNGALQSWAVPKGIPFAKGDKRLAVQVEEHPVDYIDFEGTIPKGQYGGGTVMVWDRGTYKPLSKTPAKDLAAGKLHFELEGKKLHGEWYLVRLRDGKQWLLIRGGEDLPPVSKSEDDTSALSGKTMRELSQGLEVWESNPSQKARLGFIEPMKARLVKSPPAGDWIYEIKFDGFRAIGVKDAAGVRLFSRNEKDFRAKFPEVADSIAALDAKEFILDGEIVALDEKGRPSFQLLQAREMGQERPPLFYYVFDLLHLDGEDLLHLPLRDRKARLKSLLQDPPGVIRYSGSLGTDAKQLLKKVRKLGLEGLIEKRSDSVYEPGRRSGAWIKLKLHHEQEFVIGGYTDPAGSRQYFGALLVGYYKDKRLHFAGKVGTGFDEQWFHRLSARFKALAQDKCPFVNLPEARSGRYGAGLTVAEMRRCHWLKPVLVCQVKFSEWTRDDKLRQPVFLGLREDKDAADVVRETPR